MRNPSHKIQNLMKVRVDSSTIHTGAQNNSETEINSSQRSPPLLNYKTKANLVE